MHRLMFEKEGLTLFNAFALSLQSICCELLRALTKNIAEELRLWFNN